MKRMRILTAFGLLLLIIMPSAVTEGAKRGLMLCCEVIIPSTFVFMVLITFFSRLCRNMVFKSRRIPAFIIGMLAGYPIGAKFIAEETDGGNILENDAMKLICFCVGAGPAFTVTAVGKGIFGSYSAGIILFVSQLFACMLFGVLTFFKARGKYSQKALINTQINIAESFVSSVKESCTSCLNICGFVVLFSALIFVVKACGVLDLMTNLLLLLGFDDKSAMILSGGFIEVTNGCAAVNEISGSVLTAVSFIVGFGGLSVAFQISAIAKNCKFSMRKFLLARVIIGIISAVITFILLKIFPATTETLALKDVSASFTLHSLPICIVLILFATALIISDSRKGEICINT